MGSFLQMRFKAGGLFLVLPTPNLGVMNQTEPLATQLEQLNRTLRECIATSKAMGDTLQSLLATLNSGPAPAFEPIHRETQPPTF